MTEHLTEQDSAALPPSPDTHRASGSRTAHVIVLGLGNTLMHDEGLGIVALHQLAGRGPWPDGITLLDGGVLGLELLPYVESAEALLLLDAVQTGAPPGSLVRLEGDEIPAVVALKMSVHQVGFQETLAMCRFRDTCPSRLVLWGIVPESVNLSVTLSKTVSSRMEDLVDAAQRELDAWGIRPLD